MYNETLRKITSLSLLTILLTSTAAFAMPNALPQAHASTNANLFVSAENSLYNNYFAGPQVIQVIVSDPDIQRLDQNYGEPTVTVNGKKLHMAQATDGNWYAYFADSKQAQIADSQAPVNGFGLNFGEFCAPGDGRAAIGVDMSETKGFAVAGGITNGIQIGSSTPTSATIGTQAGYLACNTPVAGARNGLNEHVVREAKALNPQGLTPNGQIGLVANVWPIIQLYDFSSTPQTVEVQYQKAGGQQTVDLTFDRIPTNLITTSLDRTVYPQSSQVFITMNDPQLQIDPTEENSWTFGANAANPQLFYQAFDRNGLADAELGAAQMVNIVPLESSMMFNHNGKFTLNAMSGNGVLVVDSQTNGKQNLGTTQAAASVFPNPFRGDPALAATAQTAPGVEPITFIESGVNSEVFQNWDSAKTSTLITDAGAIRGLSATFRYNDISTSIVGGFGFATLTTSPVNGTWSSGQKIPITLVDTDQNKNSKLTEHLDNSNPNVVIPAMTIGTPFSFTSGGAAMTLIDPGPLTVDPLTGVVTAGLNFAGIATFTGSNGLPGPENNLNFAVLGTLTSQASGPQATDPVGARLSFIPAQGTSIQSGVVIDPHTTMASLLNTIHDTRVGNAATFKGFNLFNYDVRSVQNALQAGTITSVNTILLYRADGQSIIDPIAGGVRAGTIAVQLATSTNLEDLINLSNNPGLIACVDPARVNCAADSANLFTNIPSTASIGLLFNLQHNIAQPLVFSGRAVTISADF